MKDIWFAGGCFWGTEKLFSSIKGVVSTETGYANGNPDIIPTYELVCSGQTGYRETVHVVYDPDSVSLDFLTYSFFLSINPSLKDRQGNDAGPQYQACIFWNDSASKEIIIRISEIESRRCTEFNVVLEELRTFVPAEGYHQKYLDKNIDGYCHVNPALFKIVSERVFDPADYVMPSWETLQRILTDLEYDVTQNSGTENPFDNEYYETFEKGIYVDRVTGEPLFLSQDKFQSRCGWPAFSRPLDATAMKYLDDETFGMHRIEVRSRVGNSHLGHVFLKDPESPSAIRYCINSASLRFIPLDKMDAEGYGDLVRYVR